jgi:ElaB/YqjD/DUF883 family membrane-anchored ribosome-binding protein
MTVQRKINSETGLLEDVKERISDFAGDVASKLKDKGSDIWDDVQDRGQGAWKDAKMFVRKNPGEAIGIAFVAGLLAYALLSRKSD